LKKIEDSSYRVEIFHGCRFYLDDIELILDSFPEKKYSKNIYDKDYEYETLDELKEKRGDKPSNFEIKWKENDDDFNSVSIGFNKEYTSLHSHSANNDTSKLIFEQIRKVCTSKDNRFSYPFISGIFQAGIFGAAVLLYVFFKKKILWAGVAGLGFLLMSFFSFYLSYRKPVILRRKHEGSFWKRKADDIMLALISGGIGALIGAGLTYFLTKKP